MSDRAKIRAAWSDFRRASRRLAFAIVGYAPPAVDLGPDPLHPPRVGHPSILCKCKHQDQLSKSDHDPDCEWIKRMCETCDGTGWCQTCHGDGTNGTEGDNE